MAAYIPDLVYGLIPGSSGEFGLVPWPAHMRSREAVSVRSAENIEAAGATLASNGGVFFLTIDSRDRTTVVTTIERLINLLDAIDGDPDFEVIDDREDDSCDTESGGDDEPWLGAAERHPGSSWQDRNHTQTWWAQDRCEGVDLEAENEHGREDSLDGGATEHGVADVDAMHAMFAASGTPVL